MDYLLKGSIMGIKKKNLIFIFYICVVIFLTLAPYRNSIQYDVNYNIIPFQSINNYLRHMSNFGIINMDSFHYLPFGLLHFAINVFTVSFKNLLGNVLLFVPFGLILPTFFTKKRFLRTFIYAFIFSTAIEMIQFIFLTSRRADVDDIILNVMGGILGYVVYLIARTVGRLVKS